MRIFFSFWDTPWSMLGWKCHKVIKLKQLILKWLNKKICIYICIQRDTASWGQYEQLTGESGWTVFIVLFLQFFCKLEHFQNEQVERRENMLDWMRKAKEGRAEVGLKTFHICRASWRGLGRQCCMVVRGKWQNTEHLVQLWLRACKPWDFNDAASYLFYTHI